MAKKKVTKKIRKSQQIVENVLPQNIMPIGERVEEDKNIYIYQSVYKEIHRFTKNKTVNESGGMLIGIVIEEFGKTNVIVNGFIEAKYCEATPTTLKFTHETWDYCHKEMDKKFPNQKIVGWIHTHPNFGIFLSEYDKFIQENFFKEDYQIAYVVDPIQNIEGFYFWINEKIERCKGFYKFDEMGVKIENETEEVDENIEKKKSLFEIKNIVIAILAVLVVFLYFSNLSQNKEITNLQKQQEILTSSANQSLDYMQQQITGLVSKIQILEDKLETTSGPETEIESENDTADATNNAKDNIEEDTGNTENDSLNINPTVIVEPSSTISEQTDGGNENE